MGEPTTTTCSSPPPGSTTSACSSAAGRSPALLSGWDNVGYAAHEAPAILARIGFSPAKVPAVVAAIVGHLPSGAPETIEGVILRDADILEQLGAVGILRTVSKVGRDSRFPTFAAAIAVLRRNRETLPAQLRLESARALAVPRVALLQTFLDGAAAEAGDAPL